MEQTKQKGISLEQQASREHGTWSCPGSVTDPRRAFELGVAGGQRLSVLMQAVGLRANHTQKKGSHCLRWEEFQPPNWKKKSLSGYSESLFKKARMSQQ